MNQVEDLKCTPMNYGWGKIGRDSLVYQLLESSQVEKNLNNEKPYAELWIGDHPSAPSLTHDNQRISQKFGEDLPFLAKILSVRTPLSLQCHPNPQEAIILHKEAPKFYPDTHAKPEMGIFLSEDAYLLYGFRKYEEIIRHIKLVPEFTNLCGTALINDFAANPTPDRLKLLIKELLTAPSNLMKENVLNFQNGYSQYNFDHLIKIGIDRISKYFPEDVGIFFPLLLNVIHGTFGDALFIEPGTLHAYIEGDLFEIMEVSDNVIRAAMTPKHVDISNLLKVVKFDCFDPLYIRPTIEQEKMIYRSLHDMFYIEIIKPQVQKPIQMPPFQKVAFLINLAGDNQINGEKILPGAIKLIPKNTACEISASSPDGLIIFATTPQ